MTNIFRIGGGLTSLAGAAYMAGTAGVGFTPVGLAAAGAMAVNGVGVKSLGLSALAMATYSGHWLYNGGLGDLLGSLIGKTVSEAGKVLSESFSKGAEETIKSFDFKKISDTYYEEIIKVVIELVDKVSKESADVPINFAKKIAKDSIIRVGPWIVLGTVISVGTPLGLYYGYKRLVHNIGKPKLAQECKSNNFFDRATELATNTVSFGYSSAKTYFKWSYLSSITTFVSATLIGIASEISSLAPDYSFKADWTQPLIQDTLGAWVNYFESFTEKPLIFPTDKSSRNLLSYDNVYAGTTAIGAAAVAFNAAKGIYSYISSNWGVLRSKPIFNTEVKESIDDVISATKYIKRNGGFYQNMILYGPGGTGKTMISKYIARNSGMNYMMMSGGDLAQYIKRGEHVTELTKLFEKAKNSSGDTIIFIDEAESLCRDRNKMQRDELFELLNSFLNQTGEPSKKIMLILATNMLEDIDEAVLSRMDHKVHVKPPEFQERKQILAMYATHFFTKSERLRFFDEQKLDAMSLSTDGFTGRALFKMLNTISTKQKCTRNNTLTQQMINTVVNRFVRQEQEVRLLRIEKEKGRVVQPG
ncbi:MAG: ATP-dependent zinc metalloprotease FtsH [Chlamydiae bacterium]|nr:ATP-dependent zinc metalloprotease FtsH [Chlamydiota bacterium]